ncbi:RNA polymerase rpb1 c-terminal repeat domain protein [Colletotrichum musicola]|uniref:RNA polymerase rpb1 c-terminal repeat domain protein n=1 Tax=Colletotrichum musicola TaxID=2175873 RepID=A0A8H6NWK7_9PEZI|nr:RNA polymerase rpb1 c-terminal repeat domain protein [Colletotrichum musicola]
MAETKMKNGVNGVNGINGTKPSFKGTKLYETLRNLISSANAVNSELSSLPDLEKLMESEKRLKREVEEKNKEVENIRKEKEQVAEEKSKAIDKLMKDMEDRIKLVKEEKDEEINKLRAEIQAEDAAKEVLIKNFERRAGEYKHTEEASFVTSQKLEDAQRHLADKEEEVEAAKQRVAELQRASAQSAAEVKALKADRESVILEKNLLDGNLKSKEAELQVVDSKFQQLRKDVGADLLRDYTERDLDRFRRDLHTYAEESRALVTEFFREPDSTLNVVHLPHHLEYLKRVPLPKAGSSPELRCLVAQSVIAKFLRSHIFQPFFLPPDFEAAGQDMLEYLAEDVQRATIFRCQILAVCDRNEAGKAVAGLAKDAVYRELCAFVPATKYLALQTRLTKFFEDGVVMWGHLQRSRQLVVCEDVEDEDVDDVDEAQRTKLWEEYGTRPQAEAPGGKGVIVAELFPQVLMDEGEDTINVIHPGVAVWSDQGVVVTAQQALTRSQTNGRANGDGSRPANTRRRSSSSAPSGRA